MRKLGWLAAAILLGGCERGEFRAAGLVTSDGGDLGAWRSVPQGCSRAPFDGLAIGQSPSILTFLWEDPSTHDKHREQHVALVADAPLRLEIARGDGGYRAWLRTVKVRWRPMECGLAEVTSREEAATFAGGKPTLSGRLRLDCADGERRVTADVVFERCGY